MKIVKKLAKAVGIVIGGLIGLLAVGGAGLFAWDAFTTKREDAASK